MAMAVNNRKERIPSTRELRRVSRKWASAWTSSLSVPPRPGGSSQTASPRATALRPPINTNADSMPTLSKRMPPTRGPAPNPPKMAMLR